MVNRFQLGWITADHVAFAEPEGAERYIIHAVGQPPAPSVLSAVRFLCRSCYAEYCLNCGQTKAGGRGSGYHRECGRQPSWLTALEGVPHLTEDDPRVQQPPPLLRRGPGIL